MPTAGELDELFWARIKDSTDVDDFKDYGRQFPKGVHSAEASLMARKLLRQAEASRPQPQVADSSAGLASEPVLAAPPAATGPRGSRSGNGSAAGQPGKLDAMMQQERQDFGVPATPQIHNGAMHGPTPTSIPGGQLITTKGVAALVQENRAPYLLLDALGGNTTLQGALPAAWAAQPGALGDSAEQELGQRLYQKTRGNRNVALVFFCASTHCWMSYNAALRAIDLGYRNVLWYRGGLEAWTDAGLPTVAGEQAY